MISPVSTSTTRPAAAFTLYFSAAKISSSRSACCTRRSTASSIGFCKPVGGKAREMQRLQAVAVEPFLDAGDALVVDVDVADQVRHLGAVRIDALVLGEEADARQAELVDFAALLRRDLALEPDEALARTDAVAHFGRIEIGQHRGQQLDRLVDVDDLARLGEQRRRAHVGREDHAVAVEDVGPRRRDRVLGRAAPHEMTFRRHREHHEAHGDDAHRPRRRPGSRGRRGRAPWRCDRHCGHRAACRASGPAGLWPAIAAGGGASGSGCASIAVIAAPSGPACCRSPGSSLRSLSAIASAGGGCTIAGGRSGSRSSASYCVASAGRSCRWRRARPWMRAGFSSVAHSARNAAMASRSR